MITGLHHTVLLAPDFEDAIAAYSLLLGREVDCQSTPADGAATALFVTDHTALEILAPVGEGAVGDKLREMIAADGPGLRSIAFAVENMDRFHTLLSRRGLTPTDIVERSQNGRNWRSCRIPDEKAAGIKTFFVEESQRLPAKPAADDCVHTMDHFVIATPNIERTLAHYGARMGLDLRLDRSHPEWGAHFLFFKTGGLIFEIVHRLEEDTDTAENDQIFGLTWTVKNIESAHARLKAAGLNISEVRSGRKPGSQVFTIRDATLNVPTLFISHSPR